MEITEQKFESPADNPYRLELEHRNPVQRIVFRVLIAKDNYPANNAEREEWISSRAKSISNIIDSPEHEKIRELARAKNYDEAASRVLEYLN